MGCFSFIKHWIESDSHGSVSFREVGSAINVKCLIWLRFKAKRRIRIKVKSQIRIRIEVKIREPLTKVLFELCFGMGWRLSNSTAHKRLKLVCTLSGSLCCVHTRPSKSAGVTNA